MALRFDGKVVVITGAGGGLGKVYSLFFASRGASVVVNDLGKDASGKQAADLVVEEIKAAGGKAVPNYDSVEQGDRIIETAIKAFGKIDIVINNAGILRDKSFARMTDAEWDLVQAVHVRGSYKVAKAAWDHMIKQGYGRIINTASAAGIYGNFGQANYSTAKLSLFGLSNALAREGARKNVLTNTIAPLAASKMTETVMPPDMLASLKPEFIVPLVAFLCHESSTENGSIFELGAGFVAKLRWERSKGAVFKADSSFTPGAVALKLPQIQNFTNPDYPTSIMDTDWVGLLEQAKLLQSNPVGADLRFDGRVAIVTGAGAGIGRAYALLFGKLGASVVVNDLGGVVNGAGGPESAADKVVNEIIRVGGKAVANYNSVEQGDKIVETAIKAFGKVDIIVNNAGILRDKSFARMSDEEWDLVQRVHLRGSFKVVQAAWPHFLKQKYGRIVNTSSAVGLYGNFGQANYSTAKAGLIAFSNTLALEGARSNIIVNVIAPNAGTKMTATVMPAEMVEALKPEYIAPLVCFLTHESNKSNTGGIYEVGSGWVSKVRWQRSGGFGFPVNVTLTPEHIAAKWMEITNFNDGRATYPSTTQESFSAVQGNFENRLAEKTVAKSASSIDVPTAQKAVFKSVDSAFSFRDVILYNLGLGAKRTDLDLVYEANDKFQAVPTFGVIPAFAYQMDNMPFGDFLPEFNPMMLLHGEQYLEIHKKIPTSGKFTQTGQIVDILDKGKGATVIMRVTTKDASNETVFVNEFTFFIRGLGGFGGKKDSERGAATAANEPPNRPADVIVREKTSPDQAALYRLSGDYNPLHIDPQMSSMGGFEVPILHGLCSFGIAGKHVFQKFGNYKSIKARFAKHVFPGETLETHMWKEGRKVIFICKVVERDCIAISNAAAELVGNQSSDKAPEAAVSAPASTHAAAAIFASLEAGLNALSAQDRALQIKKTNAVLVFDIIKDGKSQLWYVDLKNGNGKVGTGSVKSDIIVSVSDASFIDIVSGKLNPQKAFMTGKIKVKGNMAIASKLEGVLKLAAAPKAKL